MSAIKTKYVSNAITKLFKTEYPIIQAGMIWCSGWELASAVSNAGGLGLIGSGSMYTDILCQHIKKCRSATDKPFGVNVPLMYPEVERHMEVIVEEGVKIVFTSAGNPKKWTPFLKEHGITVAHVVSSARFAKKSEEAGVDAVVAEGFEAGGHNGREETTTLCLIPPVREAVSIPLIAAGGIASGRAMLAAMALGADGVQIGTRFVASCESSAHRAFKAKVVEAKDGDTLLVLKQLLPVRLLKNRFFEQVREYETRCESQESLHELLGSRRPKKGMFEGDMEEGELEIGQASAYIHDIKPAGQIVKDIWEEFNEAIKEMSQ
jgi:enoyl-[acyl-carrier protein] reductase II